MAIARISVPEYINDTVALMAGDLVYLSGVIYVARDQAHRRLFDAIKKGERIPIDLGSSVIYYCGPTPAPKGIAIGSCGPTTSSRMDSYLPLLMKNGLRITIGKGGRSNEAIKSIKDYNGCYMIAAGGAGAFYSQFVKSYKVIAYSELRAEALAALVVKDMPLIVAVDSKGGSVFSDYAQVR